MGGKKTKRERKFLASGGVEGRLKKGTITKKGKLRKVGKKRSGGDHDKDNHKKQQLMDSSTETKKKSRPDDFMGPENLGELDMDAFFAKFSERMETKQDDDDDEDDVQETGDEPQPTTQSAKPKKQKQKQRGDDDDCDDDKSESAGDDSNSSDEEKNETSHQTKGKTKKSSAKDDDNDESQSGESENENDDDDEIDGDDDDDGAVVSKKRKAYKTSKPNDDDDDSDSSDESETAAAKDKKAPAKSKGGDNDVDSDDDSSLEDIEAAEARMKAELAKIEKSDPEFHEFLRENESSLLQFGEEEEEKDEDNVAEDDDVVDGQDDDVDGDDENEVKNVADDDEVDQEGSDNDEGTERKEKQKKQRETRLNLKILKNLARGTFLSHSIKTLKRLLSAFKTACHLADMSSDMKNRPGESGTRYVIDSSKVFDQLMVMCFTRLHHAFRYHLLDTVEADKDGGKDNDKEKDNDKVAGDNTPINPKKFENAKKWREMRGAVLSFFRSTLHLLSGAKEPRLLAFILKSLSKYIPYLTPFPRTAVAVLKGLTELWSAPVESSEEYQVVRLNACLRIRQLALTQPFPFIEDCLKKTYLAYARRAKFASGASMAKALPTLTFMGNCLVDLYSLDYHSSYQHSFVYIRQLALLLRTAMQKKTPEAMQQVYCWQYIYCLNLWVAVLADAAKSDDGAMMRSLIYPLTEVIYGTARLIPNSTRLIPIQFHCVRLLQQLAAATEVFIPTTSLLLECLDLKEWYLKPKKSKAGTARGIEMPHILKLPKEDPLRTFEQIEAASSEFFLLMEREIELYRYSAGFPEFAVRIQARLKQFVKEVKAVSSSRQGAVARGLVDTCERYTAAAVQARSKLEEAPKAVLRLECLRPFSEPSMRERHERSLQRERKALEASRPLPAPNAKDRKEKKVDKVDDDDDKKKSKSNKKDKKRQRVYDEESESNDEETNDKGQDAVEEADEVQEGINWSDDDDDDDDDE